MAARSPHPNASPGEVVVRPHWLRKHIYIIAAAFTVWFCGCYGSSGFFAGLVNALPKDVAVAMAWAVIVLPALAAALTPLALYLAPWDYRPAVFRFTPEGLQIHGFEGVLLPWTAIRRADVLSGHDGWLWGKYLVLSCWPGAEKEFITGRRSPTRWYSGVISRWRHPGIERAEGVVVVCVQGLEWKLSQVVAEINRRVKVCRAVAPAARAADGSAPVAIRPSSEALTPSTPPAKRIGP